MRVVSAFDGMSCGQLALQRAGIPYNEYFSFEIDKFAVSIAQKNFPNTWQLGGIENWKQWGLNNVDLLIGGSPCQGFSFAGKQLNFNDPRSKLFFHFVDMLNHYKPLYFLLENVVMRKDFQDIISNFLGTEPIKINSALVSAQNRKRLYWTNIPNVTQPKDQGILLKDVIAGRIVGRARNAEGKRIDHKGSVAGKTTQEIEINKNPGKTNALSTVQKDNILIPVIKSNGSFKIKSDKSQCIDANYCKGVDNHGQRTIINCGGQYRKLTPIECERLQTIPDNYTEGVSNTQRYKMLGNGWTIDVIAHLLRGVRV